MNWKNMSEWINCKKEHPKIGIRHKYLFVNGKREVTYGYCFDIDDAGFVWICDEDRQTNEIASHFMNLPEPPK